MTIAAIDRFLFLMLALSLEVEVSLLIKSESDFFFDLSFDLFSARLCTLKVIYRCFLVALFEAEELETDTPSFPMSTFRNGLGRTE